MTMLTCPALRAKPSIEVHANGLARRAGRKTRPRGARATAELTPKEEGGRKGQEEEEEEGEEEEEEEEGASAAVSSLSFEGLVFALRNEPGAAGASKRRNDGSPTGPMAR
ncbi:unnamed protein product [Prorocentrum cordatum]|uniref:Uncharacterized protein n=1 Tax=Prorocentrum cordatum TaxID=2364126 RepID=A0ABN9WDE4_9DINO|nr:unnamed protein product [Polarella glacialis]